MGFFDAWYKPVLCPRCRTRGAEKFLFLIRCPNPQCSHYDADWARQASHSIRTSSPSAPVPLDPPRGSFDPGANAVSVRYRNFQGYDREYKVDKRTIRRKGNHLSFKAAPTEQRINFDRRFIQNLSELDHLLKEAGSEPDAREKQVLGYHLKYGTSSPLFEKIRRKYPTWSA